MATGDDREWPHGRQAVAYDEARATLEAQRETMADIDDKALRTVRVTALLIGALVAAARISTDRIFHPGLAIAAGVFLFLTILLGVATYSESDLYLGPERDFLVEIEKGVYGGAWPDAYLQTMGYWIQQNRGDIEFNGQLLLGTQASLVIGLALAALAVLL